MQSAALLAEIRRGSERFPVLDIPLVARGLSLGTLVVSPSGRVTGAGQVTGISRPGGWDRIVYGSGVEQGKLEAVRTSVQVSDPRQELLSTLETYDPRGSVARIREAAPGLVPADWEPMFLGVLEDFATEPPYTKLVLKTDDTALRAPIPAGVFLQTEWGSAAESTIFGTHMPLLFGIHDSFLVTARGMVPCVNIRYDKDLGYWWQVSASNLVEVRRIYFDGVSQSAAGWSVLRGVYGGNLMTIISITEGYQPDKGVVVTADIEGPDANGLSVGASITSPIAILRTVIEQYAYKAPSFGAYDPAVTIIDTTTWDATEAWLAARGYDCARRFGGDQNEESAAEVIASFLHAHPWARIWWTPLGKLALSVFDPDDVDPDTTAHLDLAKYHEGGQIDFAPGDRREVYSKVKMPYLWNSAESKFCAAIEAHDVAALPPPGNTLELANEWTSARFTLD